MRIAQFQDWARVHKCLGKPGFEGLTKFEQLVRGTSLQQSVEGTYYAAGLMEESAEVLEVMRKALRNGRPISAKRVEEELGDVLSWLVRIANLMGIDLESVCDTEVIKLEKLIG